MKLAAMRDPTPHPTKPDRAFDYGLYTRRLSAEACDERPCLFLDRDGVVVEETHYLHRVKDIAFVPGVAKAISRANRLGVPVVMVTNQAGIGRGYYDWKAFEQIQQTIVSYLEDHNASLNMVLACAYHTDGKGSLAVTDHPWRKPRPGMLLEANRTLGINLAGSFIVGDTISDLAAGKAAGLAQGALVMTGHGQREYDDKAKSVFAEWRNSGQFSPRVADNAGQAITEWLSSIATHRNE